MLLRLQANVQYSNLTEKKGEKKYSENFDLKIILKNSISNIFAT